MDTVGIIGAGQMGAGVAQVAAASGYAVVLVDRDLAIAETARDGIGKRLARLVDKGQLDSADADDSGILDITDPIRILGYLFLGGEAPPAPGAGACGVDRTPDRLGQCGSQCQ